MSTLSCGRTMLCACSRNAAFDYSDSDLARGRITKQLEEAKQSGSVPKISPVRNSLPIDSLAHLSHFLILRLQIRRRLRFGGAAEERDAGVDGDAEGVAERAQEESVPDQGREDHARHHHQNDTHTGTTTSPRHRKTVVSFSRTRLISQLIKNLRRIIKC